MSRRLYLGSRSLFDSCSTSSDIGYLTGLPADTRSEDVSKLFDGYGRIIDCRVMTGSSIVSYAVLVIYHCETGFGFVEFENSKVRLPFILIALRVNTWSRMLKMLSILSTENPSWEPSMLASHIPSF